MPSSCQVEAAEALPLVVEAEAEAGLGSLEVAAAVGQTLNHVSGDCEQV